MHKHFQDLSDTFIPTKNGQFSEFTRKSIPFTKPILVLQSQMRFQGNSSTKSCHNDSISTTPSHSKAQINLQSAIILHSIQKITKFNTISHTIFRPTFYNGCSVI